MPSPQASKESALAPVAHYGKDAENDHVHDEAMKRELEAIKHLDTYSHLIAMNKLIAEGCMSIDMLTVGDIMLLEMLDIECIPMTIKDKIVQVNVTMQMRIAADAQPPGMVREVQGDLLEAPVGSVVIHACNTKGYWGKGVALQMRETNPTAFKLYHDFCKANWANSSSLLGTCLLISPQQDNCKVSRLHWIACIFVKTHTGHGGSRDSILANTKSGLEDMKRQVDAYHNHTLTPPDTSLEPREYWSCRLNSGCFGIEWRHTKEVMEQVGIDVVVVHPYL